MNHSNLLRNNLKTSKIELLIKYQNTINSLLLKVETFLEKEKQEIK